jgi:diguanylate cyclase (GGDEF)-like protein
MGGVLFVFSIIDFQFDPSQLPAFFILTLLAILTQLLKSLAPGHQAYHPALIFIFAGALLLDPFLFGLLIILSHLIEWLKERFTTDDTHLRAWYIQPFNIGMHILLGLSAQTVFKYINPDSLILTSNPAIIAALCAAVTYVLLNHFMVGVALVLARGISWKESDILNFENLSTDFVMFVMGYIVAILHQLNSWLIVTALTPLYLIYRALSVPKLKQQANTDSKTGLWNAEYFIHALDVELMRSTRYRRPLSVIMADIDLLRNINNTYGHLGGDAVLIGVAKILTEHFREYDIICRFGGEEFAILLPETSPGSAYSRVEDVRKSIQKASFKSPMTQANIKATMSFGIAGVNGQEINSREIIHQADIAVYDAKLNGRNRTTIFSEEIADLLGVGMLE